MIADFFAREENTNTYFFNGAGCTLFDCSRNHQNVGTVSQLNFYQFIGQPTLEHSKTIFQVRTSYEIPCGFREDVEHSVDYIRDHLAVEKGVGACWLC